MKMLKIVITCFLLMSLDSKAQNNVCLNNQTDIGGMFSWVLGQNGYATGDFNNDNIVDFLLPPQGGFTFAISLSNGPSSYSPLSQTTTVGTPYYMVGEDFNNDGNDDVAISCPDSNRIVIMNGNGIGSFTSTTKYNVLFPPGQITSDDLNNDGFKDIAVCTGTNSFYVFLNNGSGGFSSLIYSFSSSAILIDDFNNDGFKDLYIFGGNGPFFMKNTGNGVFLFETNFNFPVNCTFDLNNDGLKDLFGIYSYSLFAYLNTGNFTFGTPTIINSGFQYPGWIAKGDINNDGLYDLNVTNVMSGNIATHLNNGAGGFLAPIIYTTNPILVMMESIHSLDADGNGKTDLAVHCNNGGITIIYNCSVTGINKVTETKLDVELYPNPSNGLFHLDSKDDLKSIEIIDISGKVVQFKNKESNEIDLKGKDNGFYFLSGETINGERFNLKLIKTD